MTIQFVSLIISGLCIPWAALITVTIRGNKAVKRYGNLHLNCSSETIPSRKAADIQINGISHTSLAWLNGECFSRDIGQKCSPNICSCSGSGSWFSYIYKVVQPESNLSISCSMSFGEAGSISDSIIVRIIEFSDPEIKIDPPMPITAGSIVTLTCILVKTNEDIHFKWDCIEHKIVIGTKVLQNNLTFSTLIIRNLNLTHDNETCTCSVHVEDITSKDSFQISISRIPVIETEEEIRCNGSSLPTMTCLIRTDLQSYGFYAWLHRYNDILVRTLNGSMLDTKSILQLRSCSYEDAGEYTCVAWNIYDGNYYTANETVTLHVNVPPVIITSRTFRERKTVFSVLFYSITETMCAWQQSNRSLINSTQVMQTIDTRNIDVQFYNVTIACEVYEANLSISFPTETYEVLLQNSFGESRFCFDRGMIKSKEVTSSFNLWILIVGLISFGTFTLTAVGTIILAKGKQCNNVIHIVGPHERCPTIPIYHSAPAYPDVPHVYDTPEAGYLEVVDDTYEQYDVSENKEEEPQDEMTINREELYEEIE